MKELRMYMFNSTNKYWVCTIHQGLCQFKEYKAKQDKSQTDHDEDDDSNFTEQWLCARPVLSSLCESIQVILAAVLTMAYEALHDVAQGSIQLIS